jgi:hypothetical protein
MSTTTRTTPPCCEAVSCAGRIRGAVCSSRSVACACIRYNDYDQLLAETARLENAASALCPVVSDLEAVDDTCACFATAVDNMVTQLWAVDMSDSSMLLLSPTFGIFMRGIVALTRALTAAANRLRVSAILAPKKASRRPHPTWVPAAVVARVFELASRSIEEFGGGSAGGGKTSREVEAAIGEGVAEVCVLLQAAALTLWPQAPAAHDAAVSVLTRAIAAAPASSLVVAMDADIGAPNLWHAIAVVLAKEAETFCTTRLAEVVDLCVSALASPSGSTTARFTAGGAVPEWCILHKGAALDILLSAASAAAPHAVTVVESGALYIFRAWLDGGCSNNRALSTTISIDLPTGSGQKNLATEVAFGVANVALGGGDHARAVVSSGCVDSVMRNDEVDDATKLMLAEAFLCAGASLENASLVSEFCEATEHGLAAVIAIATAGTSRVVDAADAARMLSEGLQASPDAVLRAIADAAWAPGDDTPTIAARIRAARSRAAASRAALSRVSRAVKRDTASAAADGDES